RGRSEALPGIGSGRWWRAPLVLLPVVVAGAAYVGAPARASASTPPTAVEERSSSTTANRLEAFGTVPAARLPGATSSPQTPDTLADASTGDGSELRVFLMTM